MHLCRSNDGMREMATPIDAALAIASKHGPTPPISVGCISRAPPPTHPLLISLLEERVGGNSSYTLSLCFSKHMPVIPSHFPPTHFLNLHTSPIHLLVGSNNYINKKGRLNS